MKNTLVLGASENPSRYSHIATERLTNHGHKVWPVGLKPGMIGENSIETEFPKDTVIDTVTLYLNPGNQEKYYDSILALHPKRIIFNPGTENPDFEKLAAEKGIETVIGCTLVMLASKEF